mmetsp:Transcript_98568/g.193601  ORF Transcript_98568/g.193601 Transcript_98568/m.193601 type:complete len:536 (-) Transcript_98568:136-1743(-)
MCRLTIYKGRPVLIGDIVISPENSLLYQSRDAAYHPGVIDKTNRRNILVNGDGFGISWYGDELSKGSCCFKFVTPAWSDTNLRNIGRHISSPMIFAHVRAASSGHNPFEPMIVSNENCHPFTFKEFTFMHNGGIPSFQTIKLQILNLLSPETFANIKGTTDTEHIFALYLNCLPQTQANQTYSEVEMVDAMNRTITIILKLCKDNGIKDHCSLNLCVTNGLHIIATRFRTGPKPPPSLYYNIGSNFICNNGSFYAENNSDASEIVISSAPLSKVTSLPGQVPELEQDNEMSFTTDGGTPATSTRLSAGTPRATLRASTSTSCFSSLLDPAKCSPYPNPCNVPETDTEVQTDSDNDIGAWILIPKNHMLVCKGDVMHPHRVESFYLEPVASSLSITSPLQYPVTACFSPTVSATPHATIVTSHQLSHPTGSNSKSKQSEDNHIVTAGTIGGKRSAVMAAVDDYLQEQAQQQQQQQQQQVCAEVIVHPEDVSSVGINITTTTHASSTANNGNNLCTGVVFSPNCKHRPKVMKFTCNI